MLGINTAHRFKDLPDGRMYFYPHGRNGRSYPLGGLILPAIEWLMGERAAEHLVEASETYTAAELRERVLEQPRWMIGLSGLLLFGASAITSAREIQQKQHMNQQKCSRAR